MPKLIFRYGAMNCGKSTNLLQVQFNYLERGLSALTTKPIVDTKGDMKIVSRLGVCTQTSFMVGPDAKYDSLLYACEEAQRSKDKSGLPAVLLVDEAQFLSPTNVEALLQLATNHFPVIAYGLRTDYRAEGFPGSSRLLELAHDVEELVTICHCGRKARFNQRIDNGGTPILDKESGQVSIEGESRYISRCSSCFVFPSEEEGVEVVSKTAEPEELTSAAANPSEADDIFSAMRIGRWD